MSNFYDAVVIGAGHNGLTTAAYLARAGLSTLLVEARDIVGGTAASERLGGSIVNVCNCDHLAFRTTPIAEELDLSSHGLTYINLDPAQVNGSWESDRWWASYHDLDRTVETIARVLPGEAFNYVSKLAQYRKAHPVLATGKLMQFIPQDGVYAYFRYNDQGQAVMVLLNGNKDEKTVDGARFAERTGGFTGGTEIMTGAALADLKTFKIPGRTAWVVELRK